MSTLLAMNSQSTDLISASFVTKPAGIEVPSGKVYAGEVAVQRLLVDQVYLLLGGLSRKGNHYLQNLLERSISHASRRFLMECP